MAKYVAQDREAAGETLGEVLKRQPIVNALLELLWPLGTVKVSGAVSLLKRLTKSQNEQAARRWLNVLNQAGLVAYNRNNPADASPLQPAELVRPRRPTIANATERTSSPATCLTRTCSRSVSYYEPRACRFAGGSSTCQPRCSKYSTASWTELVGALDQGERDLLREIQRIKLSL
jgi:hypothetical protein